MKTLIVTFLLMASAVHAAEVPGAKAELLLARTALEETRFRDVFQHAARVQVFYYHDTDAVAEALYYETMADYKLGNTHAKVSALTELKALYTDSVWCQKATTAVEIDGGK